MDAVFAILVLGAVIFFGALISAGNERQRKALDRIREQTAQWAIQDLRLKREKLARDVKVDDPIAWLNQVVAKVYGENLDLTVTEVFDNPQALVCTAKDGRKVVLSPIAPNEVRRFGWKMKGRLSQTGILNPLLDKSIKWKIVELSVLTTGIMFDLEIEIAWPRLTRRNWRTQEPLWLLVQ